MKSVYSIVGMQHRPGADAILKTAVNGEALRLVRDPNNRFDSNAIEVWCSSSHIGFIKGSENADIAREMDAHGIIETAAKLTWVGRWPHAEVEL